MRTLVLLLGLSILLGSAAGEEPEYKGKSLDYWIKRTQSEYDVSERREAIRTLERIAMMQGYCPPFSASNDWVAAAVVPTVIGLLKDKEADVRQEASLALCGIPRKASKAAIPALAELLGDPNARVRQNATSALSFRGPAAEPAIPALMTALRQDTSTEVRLQAAVALRTAGPRGFEHLLGTLDDKNPDVRRVAVAALDAKYPGMEPYETPLKALPKLVTLFDDDNLEVRKGAVRAVVRISNVPPEPLAQLLRHKDAEIRHIAARSLLLMPAETKRFQTELLDLINSDMAFCRNEARLLSRVGAKSIPILMKLLDHHDPKVRGNAADALGYLGSEAKEAAGLLKRLLTDLTEIPLADLDDRVCHHAGAALNRILGDRDYREGLPSKRPDGK